MTSPALLVMDIQNGVVDRFAEQVGPLLTTLAETASAARESGVPVVYVRVAFRVGAPEISPMSQTFRNLGRAGMGEADTATQILSVVAPQAGDIVVTKRRVSAFVGSDLDVVLRSLDVDSLVLTGIATSGVVLSALRQAADLDFGLTVLRDGCVDADEEVHWVHMDKLSRGKPRSSLPQSGWPVWSETPRTPTARCGRPQGAVSVSSDNQQAHGGKGKDDRHRCYHSVVGMYALVADPSMPLAGR